MTNQELSDAAQAIPDAVISAKWNVQVLRALLNGPKRFSNIKGDIPGISANVLTARLRSLEDMGIVQRATLPAPADRVVYELTRLGMAAKPALEALSQWALAFRLQADATHPSERLEATAG